MTVETFPTNIGSSNLEFDISLDDYNILQPSKISPDIYILFVSESVPNSELQQHWPEFADLLR